MSSGAANSTREKAANTAVKTTTHHFTVDVEEHFQVNAFERVVQRSDWPSHPSRVERSMDVLLDLLARHEATATFFVLGWVALRHKRLVRRLVDNGHEVASHGFWHRRVTTLTPEEFRADIRHSKAVIEDAAGVQVEGFRAPSFSIVPGREWAFDVLLEEGYSYDSSIFPIRRSGYGYPGAPTAPYTIERRAGSLREYPLTTLRVFGLRVPAAGGGYLRQFPLGVIRRAFVQSESEGIPGVFYIHPWELDPGQPRLPVGALTRLRHYRGLESTAARIDALLGEFRFASIAGGVPAARAAA
jgi:polysaccharide deacetylase family protein (PEP-CTERM system associated)